MSTTANSDWSYDDYQGIDFDSSEIVLSNPKGSANDCEFLLNKSFKIINGGHDNNSKDVMNISMEESPHDKSLRQLDEIKSILSTRDVKTLNCRETWNHEGSKGIFTSTPSIRNYSVVKSDIGTQTILLCTQYPQCNADSKFSPTKDVEHRNRADKGVQVMLFHDECNRLNSSTSSTSTKDVAQQNKANKGIQVMLFDNECNRLNSTSLPSFIHSGNDKVNRLQVKNVKNADLSAIRSKCINLEMTNATLLEDIRLLQIKLNQEKITSNEILEAKKIAIKDLEEKFEELTSKIKVLEDTMRYGKALLTTKQEVPLVAGNDSHYRSDSKVTRLNLKSGFKNWLYNKHVSIRIMADSHGKNIARHIRQKSCYQVYSVIKPGAKAIDILCTSPQVDKTSQTDNVLVIIAGANDIYCNNSENFLTALKSYLMSNLHACNVICTVPIRYDLPKWSIVNKEIIKVNQKIQDLKKDFRNLHVIELDNIGKRFHTYHGLHLNNLGKNFVCDRILEVVRNHVPSYQGEVRSLPRSNQGNLW